MRFKLFFNVVIILLTSLFFGCSVKKTTLVSKNTTNINYYPKNVKIYEQTSKSNLGPCEPSIAINYNNPSIMVAGSVLNFVHVSKDGGVTWQTSTLKSRYGVWGDPTLLSDQKGNFYYFHLSDPEGTNWKSEKILDRIVMQKSTDYGASWTEGTSIGHHSPKQQDKQWALIHPKKNNLLYSAWTEFDKYNSSKTNDKSRILFSKSTDYGKNWSTPTQISDHLGNCLDDDLTPEGTTLAVSGNNLYVSWAYDSKIWFSKSIDQGVTWTKNTTIATQPNGWKYDIKNIARANGFPVMKIDHSKSEYKGTIYLNWSSQINDKETAVFLSKSIDNGNSWSLPQKVHTTIEKHHFFNWMDVDPKTGYIYVVYYRQINSTSPNIEVCLSVSKNGGKSFKAYTISKKPFNPKGANFFGDYNNICAFNGIIRPIWTQVENGLVSVWTALIDEKRLN